MGLEARHAYRFGYLQSEHWQNLRIQKLAECDARCHFCNYRSIKNDVHHIHYPKNLLETQLFHLRVLCREHHEFIHRCMDKHEEKRPDGLGGWSAYRHDLKLFKDLSISVEEKMRKEGKPCFTFHGGRLQSKGHVDRVTQGLFASEKETLKAINRAVSKIRSISVQWQSPHIDSAIVSMELALKEFDANFSYRKKVYAVDFIKNETAG